MTSKETIYRYGWPDIDRTSARFHRNAQSIPSRIPCGHRISGHVIQTSALKCNSSFVDWAFTR